MIETKYTIGCDPEIFLFRDGAFISGEGIIPGTKQNPHVVKNGAIQLDGFAAEFNIAPVNNVDDWNKNITYVLNYLYSIVYNHDETIELRFTPVANFDKEYFLSFPKESRQLGCTPDYNIYGTQNPAPDLLDIPFRTAAGHIHIGWGQDFDVTDPAHFEDCRFIAEHFYKSGIFNSDDKRSQQRLGYYGYQGSFRPKSYGVELRSPDNLWVESPESRIKMFSKVVTQLELLG